MKCCTHRNEFASLSLLERASIFRNGLAWNHSERVAKKQFSAIELNTLKISRIQPAISLQETTYSTKKLVQVKENVLKYDSNSSKLQSPPAVSLALRDG